MDSMQEPSGLIFDIERFSVRDGPGIRTVAFFKGCNLHCSWCHNVEGISPKPSLLFDAEKCVLCGACANVCLRQAHEISAAGHMLRRERCNECFQCASVCFSGAIMAAGKRFTASALAEQLTQDEAYYDASGGGVTLSGGEVMCQRAFAADVLRRLKATGVHTAIETNLSFPWREYAALLPFLDLIMADVKTTDAAVYRRHIGSGLGNVMENIRQLRRAGIPHIIRTPIIHGVNDDEQMIEDIARMLAGDDALCYYELLSYHPLGVEKARELGLRQPRFDIPKKEAMQALGRAAARQGISVRMNGKIFEEGRP